MIGHETRIDTGTDTGRLLAQLAASVVATLEAEGIEDPLGQPLTLACVLSDLFHAAGEPLPFEVALKIEERRAPIIYGMG